MPKNTYLQMISTLIVILLIILALLSLSHVLGERSKCELLLRLKPGVDECSKARVLMSVGVEVVDEIPEISVLVVRVPQNSLPSVISALSRNPTIDFVEENCRVPPSAVPNDEYYGFQWHLKKVGAPDAWDISLGDSNVMIAVLDSGVDISHSDLAGKLLQGYNFYDNNHDIMDYSGHGTAVAGVAAVATNNSLGVAAMGWRCSILPVRVTDEKGYTSYSLLARGLTYAADRGAKVAVVPFQIFGGQSLSSAAKYFMEKGGLVVASGGNKGSYCGDSDNPYVISVSGTTSSDVSWGTYGPFIDLSAPCSAIYTTIKGGGYGNVGGTSFSAPLTAGLAALIFSANPSLTSGQVEQILESTAVDLGSIGYDIYYGWGRIDASKALKTAVGTATLKDTVQPNVTVTYPNDGATVSGSITVKVDASDDVGVSKVELYKDGSLFATDVELPYEFCWNTTSDPNGLHESVAKAYDKAGNVGESSPVTVNVSNTLADATPPVVSIDYPLEGMKVSGRVDMSISATDGSGVSKVEFYIDDQLKSTVCTLPYAYCWNTRSVKNGWHTISVKAYDSYGNNAIVSIKVQVSNKK